MTVNTSHIRRLLALTLLLLGMLLLFLLAGCDGSGETDEEQTSTSSTNSQDGEAGSGDVEAVVGETVRLGEVRLTVNSLQATFQPALPGHRLSERTPSAPAAGESFYQAYVRVENLGVPPVRVDPLDFTCVVENTVLPAEVTRSGPPSRSLLKNTSFDLILTFKAQAGFVPELRYSPAWYDGTVRITPTEEGSEGAGSGPGTTEQTEDQGSDGE